MKLNLMVADGVNKGKVINVAKAQFLVGRDSSCQLRPASQSVSKRHCVLLLREGRAFVRDLKSTNGTFVNDQPVEGEVELHNDDKLLIGPLAFTVRIEGAGPGGDGTGVPVDAPTPMPEAKAETKTEAKPKTKGKAKVVDDESVADMLLKLDEEEEAAAEGLIDDNIPGGSTCFEMPALTNPEEAAPPPKAATSKYDETKAAQANTSSAAKDILEKYTRRSR
jgi:pSer/pThr/pTyr-binding forkhead associated (FHA) protein